jgi:hypothetical protein
MPCGSPLWQSVLCDLSKVTTTSLVNNPIDNPHKNSSALITKPFPTMFPNHSFLLIVKIVTLCFFFSPYHAKTHWEYICNVIWRVGSFFCTSLQSIFLEAIYVIKQFDLFTVFCSWESCNSTNVLMDMLWICSRWGTLAMHMENWGGMNHGHF